MRKNNQIKTLACMAAVSFLMTLLAASGILDRADLTVSDAFYQSRSASDGEIVLVGIDQKALEDIGPYSQWGRDIIAMALEALNASEECRPAVIALDVLYSGETDETADQWLAEAAGQYGNVVTACAAEYGSTLVEDEEGEYHLDTFSVTAFDAPYDALQGVTEQGHINAMLDTDGILRHHLLYVDLPDGTRVPSLALAAVQKYRDFYGMDFTEYPPVDARGFWYVPFCGVPGDLDESISVADLLSGAVPADYFAGKIVMIGPYAAGLQDSYLTSADHARPMYGVEFQANAVQALLWGTYKQEVGDRVQLLALFSVLLACMCGFWKRRVRVSTVLWLLLCGGSLLLCRVLYSRGKILHVLWIPVGVTILYIGCIALNYVRAALEKHQVTRMFKHYVAPKIVNEILKEGVDILNQKGKVMDIAVLFVDVRGFTSMSERLQKEQEEKRQAGQKEKTGPERVVEILDQYLTLVSECIFRYDGTLDKFVGDAAMAFWGAPLEQEDYVMQAVRAAMDMITGLEKLNEQLNQERPEDEEKISVSFGIGIHVGKAVIGNIGSPKRKDYTAIGDTVNTAARLESKAPPGTIYISRAVADVLKGRIRTGPSEYLELKGKTEMAEVFTVEEILG